MMKELLKEYGFCEYCQIGLSHRDIDQAECQNCGTSIGCLESENDDSESDKRRASHIMNLENLCMNCGEELSKGNCPFCE